MSTPQTSGPASEGRGDGNGGRRPWLRSPWIFLSLVGVAVFAFAYWSVLSSFRAETTQRARRFAPGTGDAADHVDVEVSVAQVDAARELIAIRAKLVPRGKYGDPRGRLTRGIRVRVNGYKGPVELPFKERRRIGAVETTLQLHEGDLADYPLDRYRATLALEVESDPAEVGPDGRRARVRIPTRVVFSGNMHGMRIATRMSDKSREGFAVVRIELDRSGGTVFFAFTVMGIMAVLTLLVLAVIGHILYTGRRPEVNLFGWMGGMLFAFPAIRSALPGSPPIGSFIDYLVFFWAEGFVAIGLVLTVTAWLLRPPK